MCPYGGALCFCRLWEGSGLVMMCCRAGMGDGVLETSLNSSRPDSSFSLVEPSPPVLMGCPL